jgi:hypothetical protein
VNAVQHNEMGGGFGPGLQSGANDTIGYRKHVRFSYWDQ